MLRRVMSQSRKGRPVAPGLTLLLALVLLFTSLPLPANAAVALTVSWDPTSSNITNTNQKSVFPWTVVDSNGRTHIVYAAETSAGSNTYDLVYINNIGGSFGSPQPVERRVNIDRDPSFALALGPGNVLHVAYAHIGKDNRVYYRRGTLNGSAVSWSNPEPISSAKSFGAHLVVDSGNNAHITWIDNSCGTYHVYYRVRFNNGSLGGIESPNNDCEFENHPEISITNDGRAHIVYRRGSDIFYSRRDPGGWAPRRNISSSGGTGSFNPSIGTDGFEVYIAWDENVRGHDIQFRRTTNNTENLSSIISISSEPGFASYPSVVYSPSARNVYVSWSDVDNSSDARTEVWYREFDPRSGESSRAIRLTSRGGDSNYPVIAVGGSRVSISWQDRNTGVLQVFYVGGAVSGITSGTPKLEGGATTTRKTSGLTLSFENAGDANQVRWRWGAAPTDAENDSGGYKPLNSTVNAPQGISTSVCDSRTLYTQLRNSSNNQVQAVAATTAITFDLGVQASVDAMNPRMIGLPPVYTADADLTDPVTNDTIAQGGASNGHPGFTRLPQYFLSIENLGDCSGLARFRIDGSSAEVNVPAGGFGSAQSLPGGPQAGLKQFTVIVSDTLQNTLAFPQQLVYDPANTDFTNENPNNAGLPVNLNPSATVSADTNTGSVLRRLTFSNVNVRDNLYGSVAGVGPSLPDGRQFWGVWVANSHNVDVGAGDLSLTWFPVEVENPGPNFSINWNLFAGLGYGLDPNRSGTYYVYVRFLDGAGNPSVSSTALKATVTLAPEYEFSTMYLPQVAR